MGPLKFDAGREEKKTKKNEDPRSLGLFRELTLTLKDIEKTSSVGDQLRDPKLPPYGSLYRSIATDHWGTGFFFQIKLRKTRLTRESNP